MKSKIKKFIAPVVITIVMVLYFIGYAAACMVFKQMPIMVKVAGILIPLGLAGVCVFVLLERIKEIRSGEEDDLSQY